MREAGNKIFDGKKSWFRVDVPLNQYPLNDELYIYTWLAEH